MHRTHASAQINKSEQTGMQAHRFQFSTYYIDIQPNCEYRINEQHVFFVLFFWLYSVFNRTTVTLQIV